MYVRRMPRKTHWSNGGAVGVELTPHMVEMLVALRDTPDSNEVARRLETTREALAAMVRYIERKVGAKLFSRRPGRGGSLWHLLDSAQPLLAWCDAHPEGGRDYLKFLDSVNLRD